MPAVCVGRGSDNADNFGRWRSYARPSGVVEVYATETGADKSVERCQLLSWKRARCWSRGRATNSPRSLESRPLSRRVPVALASFALSAGLTAIGSFRGSGTHEWRSWLIVLAISAAVTAIVFWAIVPRIGNLDRGSLILAIIGAVAIVVFWAGVPVPIAGGAALLALEARERAATRSNTAALAIAGLTVIAAIALAFAG